MRNLSRRATKGAFTLVELLVVVVLIAILASIAVPKFMNSGVRGREASMRADLKLYRNAIELFTNDTGLCPLTMADLAATSAPTHGADQAAGTSTVLNATLWNGPYLYAVMNDPITNADDWTYSVTAGSVGDIHAATGTALDGSDYSTW